MSSLQRQKLARDERKLRRAQEIHDRLQLQQTLERRREFSSTELDALTMLVEKPLPKVRKNRRSGTRRRKQ